MTRGCNNRRNILPDRIVKKLRRSEMIGKVDYNIGFAVKIVYVAVAAALIRHLVHLGGNLQVLRCINKLSTSQPILPHAPLINTLIIH